MKNLTKEELLKLAEEYLKSVYEYKQQMKDIRESLSDYKKSMKKRGLNIKVLDRIIKIKELQKKLEIEDGDIGELLEEIVENKDIKLYLERVIND